MPPPIPGGVVTTVNGKADMNVPTDDKDLDEQYELEMRSLGIKPVKEKEVTGEAQKQKDYYAGFRSCVVLMWMFMNFALAAGILNSAGLDRMTNNDAETERKRSQVYLAVVLWSVAGLSAFRFLGCTWFLILRLVSFCCIRLWAGFADEVWCSFVGCRVARPTMGVVSRFQWRRGSFLRVVLGWSV